MNRFLLQFVGGRRLTAFRQGFACVAIFAITQVVGAAVLEYQATPAPAAQSPQFRPTTVLVVPPGEVSDGPAVRDLVVQPYLPPQTPDIARAPHQL
jgi:hypothetical protein